MGIREGGRETGGETGNMEVWRKSKGEGKGGTELKGKGVRVIANKNGVEGN